MVSNINQEKQNQVVHEVSKRQIFDHCWDLQGATIWQSSVIKLKMLTSSIANVCVCVCVREREGSESCLRTFYCSNLVKLGADNCHFL